MDCYFTNVMTDLLNCSDDELRKISDKIAEQLETRKKLKRKETFDAFMDALGVMARDYPYEVFDIESSNGEYMTLDWEDLYKNFIEMM